MLLFIVTSDWGEVVVHNAGINYKVVKDLYCEHGAWIRKLRMDSWVHARLLFPDLQAGWDRAWLELDNGVGSGEMPALKVLRSHDMLNQAVGDIVAEFRCF